MVTGVINILKKNPLIWKLSKTAVYAILGIKGRWLAIWHNLSAKYNSAIGVTAVKREIPLIVSFTSYGHRISRSHITAQSILKQSLKADRVILWLAYGEKITPQLQKLANRGLEIQFCDDLRSYKKIIPALELYPKNVIVTADDDIIYPRNWLAKLYNEHLRHPGDVCCHRAHLITKGADGVIQPYNAWKWCIRHTDHIAAIFPTSGGGALYPPGSLHSEVTNRTAFQELVPYADDIWLKAMSLKRGTLSRVVSHKPIRILTSTPGTQKLSALRVINIDQNQNDVQFKKVFTHYDLYKLLD